MSVATVIALPRTGAELFRHAIYFLLLLDWALFAHADWLAARMLYGDGAGLLAWTHAFATTLDLSAWFVLLLLFEFELRRVAAGRQTAALRHTVHALRLLCALVILHTVFANLDDVLAAHAAAPPAASGVLRLAWFALIESLCWVLIVGLLLIDERAARRRVVPGGAARWRRAVRLAAYLLLLLIAAGWAADGEYLYAWDECLWIAGFAGIDHWFRRVAAGMRGAAPAAAAAPVG